MPLRRQTYGYLPSRRALLPLDRYLYCLMTEARMCEQLAQDCHLKARGRESNPRPFESQVERPNHYTTTRLH